MAKHSTVTKLFPAMAKAFGVRIEDLIVGGSSKALAKRPGPIGEVQRAFEEVRKLPRKQQRKMTSSSSPSSTSSNGKAS